MAAFSLLDQLLPLTSSFSTRTLVEGDPRLPPELERLIFELAASRSSSSAATLTRVCKRAYEWIRPLLYYSLTLSDDHLNGNTWSKNLLNYIVALPNRPSHHQRQCLSYLRRYTKRIVVAVDPRPTRNVAPKFLPFTLGVTPSISRNVASKFLSFTPSVTHLILRASNVESSAEYIWTVTSLPLQHLYFILGCLNPFISYSMDHPNLRWSTSLTHLLYYGTMRENLDLHHFQNLSHFGGSKGAFSHISVPLERPNFKVCIWFTVWRDDPNQTKLDLAPQEPKVVFLPQKCIVQPLVEMSDDSWSAFDDVWAQAEKIAERQAIGLRGMDG